MDPDYQAYDNPEHQALVSRAHALIAAITSRPGGTKLLRGVLPVLEQYAAYKIRRQRVRSDRRV